MTSNLDDQSFLLQQAAIERRAPVSQDDFRYLLRLIKAYLEQQQQSDSDDLSPKLNKKQMLGQVHTFFNAYLNSLGKPPLSISSIRNLIANRKRSYAAARKVMNVTGVTFNSNTMMLDASDDDYKRAAEYPDISAEDIQLAKKVHIYWPFYQELDLLDGSFDYPKPFSPSSSRTNIASLISNAPSYDDPDRPTSPQVNPELAALDASNYSRGLVSSPQHYDPDSPAENDYPQDDRLQSLEEIRRHQHTQQQQQQQQLLTDLQPSSSSSSSNMPLSAVDPSNATYPDKSQPSNDDSSRHHIQRRPPVSQTDFITLLLMIRDYQMDNTNSNAPGYKKRMFDYIHGSFNHFLELNNKQTLTVSAIKNLIANRKRSYTAAKKVMNSIRVGFDTNTMRLDATEEDFARALQISELSAEDVQLARQVLIYYPLYDEIDMLDNVGTREMGQATVLANNAAERINEFLLNQQQQQQQQQQMGSDYNQNIYADHHPPLGSEIKQQQSDQHIPILSTSNQANMVRKIPTRPLQRRPPVSPEDFCHLLTLVREYETSHPDHNTSNYKKYLFDRVHDQFNEYLASTGKTALTVSAIRNLIANRKRSYTAAKKVMRALNVKFNLETMKLDASEEDFKRAARFADISAEDVQMAKGVLIYFPLYEAIDSEGSAFMATAHAGMETGSEHEDAGNALAEPPNLGAIMDESRSVDKRQMHHQLHNLQDQSQDMEPELHHDHQLRQTHEYQRADPAFHERSYGTN